MESNARILRLEDVYYSTPVHRRVRNQWSCRQRKLATIRRDGVAASGPTFRCCVL